MVALCTSLIGLVWVIWVVYWVARSFGNKRTVFRTHRLWRFAAFIVILGVIAVSRIDPIFFSKRLIRSTDAIAVTGTLLCFLGTGFSAWAREALGRNWSGNPTLKEGHELIRTGPYRWVRHPIYTGILLAVFGSCLVGGRVRELVLFLCLTLMLVIKLRIEESLMLRQFGESYAEYRRQTKALVPLLF